MRLATSLFTRSFASRPALAASAPGRVNLIGEHTDYNGGPVLPLAIDRRTAVAVAPHDRWIGVSDRDGIVHEVDPAELRHGHWTAYLGGVVRELEHRRLAPLGARVAVATTVPLGAGLSSSAALTVALAKALTLLARRRVAAAELADIAYRAEHDHVGVRCGRMDQTIAAHGRRGTAILFETGAGTITPVPFPGRLWLADTGVSHRLTGGALNQRRHECEEALARCREAFPQLGALADLTPDDLPRVEVRLPPPLRRRVRHVVTETARTRAAAAALARGDLPALGELLIAGHRSLRDDYESTVPEADHLVDAAVRSGAYGARLTGAGWGGAVVLLLPEANERRIVAEVSRAFEDRFGRALEAWATRASDGVRREAIGAVADA